MTGLHASAAPAVWLSDPDECFWTPKSELGKQSAGMSQALSRLLRAPIQCLEICGGCGAMARSCGNPAFPLRERFMGLAGNTSHSHDE